MIKIEINDKTYDFPTSWEDVDMKTYCKCFYHLPKTDEKMDDVEKTTVTLKNEATIISRLLGEADDFVLGLPIGVFGNLASAVKFIYNIDEFLDSKIFYLKIDGKKYWMPRPEEMSLRQYIDADMIMRRTITSSSSLSCYLVYCYRMGMMERQNMMGTIKSLFQRLRG